MPAPGGALVIRSARLLDGDWPVDVAIEDGRIARIGDVGAAGGREELDAGGGLLTPAFVEPHFHADKTLTFPRLGPVDSTSIEATLARGERIKSQYTREDVAERAGAALELAIAHGVTAMRVQVDVDTISGLVGLEGLLNVRERFSDVLDVQLVAFPQMGIARDPGVEELLRAALAAGADVLGGGPDSEVTDADRADHLDRLFAIATEHDVDLDVHVDFSDEPGRRDLERLAERTIRRGWVGRVNACHCCAMEAYPDEYAARVVAKVRQAGVQVCVCPVGNLQLVGAADRMPRGRGTARLKELLAAGVNVAAGSDNMHDMWFRFGRMDPAEVAMITALAARLRSDSEIRLAFDLVTVRAARYLSLPPHGVVEGAPGDLIVFSARRLEDILRNAPGRRTTIKGGRIVGGSDSTAWTAVP